MGDETSVTTDLPDETGLRPLGDFIQYQKGYGYNDPVSLAERRMFYYGGIYNKSKSMKALGRYDRATKYLIALLESCPDPW